MTYKQTALRFVRYAVVGVVTNLAGYLVYLAITSAGAGPKSTATVLYAVGATMGYFGNRNWAFRHSGNMLESWTGYCLFHVGGYLLNMSLLHIFVDKLGFPHQLVQAVAIVIVACYLFVALNMVVFRARTTARPNE